ncbi:MAG: sulfotransferase family 2 domain-containing protein, partial [Candidatus Dadabacteria bacterium]
NSKDGHSIMIISHKYKFIFIKTRKTAGSSIQIYLSDHCGQDDIVSPIDRPERPYNPRNYRGFYNPVPELMERHSPAKIVRTLGRFLSLKKFQSHIKARELRGRIPRDIWDGYFKFTVERNPWDKVLSHYHFVRQRYSKYDKNISFEEYLDVAELPYNYTKYTDLENNIIVDRVVKYEHLNEELGEIFQELGVPFSGSLGPTEKSHYRKDRRPYQEVYTPEQKLAVAKLFDQEIEMHGYEF